MAEKKQKTIDEKVERQKKIAEVRLKLATIRLDIKAGQEKNTNAHKALKKELARLLTK